MSKALVQVVNRLRGRHLWLWLAPVIVAVAVRELSEHRIEYGIGGAIALLLVAWGIRRPGRALVVLAVFLPLQTVGFGFLLALHVPGAILRPAGGLKDVMAGAILIAAIRHIRGTGQRLDKIDKLALVYVAVVTSYLLVPHLFVPNGPGQWNVRLLAWRADCDYVLIFLAARYAPIPESSRKWFIRVVLGIGVLTVGAALYQFASPHAFSRLILDTGRQVQYQLDVLHNQPTVVAQNLAYLTTYSPFRVSSIFISPFDMSDYLVVVAAIVLERVVRGQRSHASYLLLAGVLFALFASRVRADALAVVILVLIALVPTPKRPRHARARLILALAFGLVIVIPSLAGTRFVGAQGGAASNQGHLSELSYGITVLESHPLGLGIGTNPATGNRFVQPGKLAFISDNSLLQVGDELGWLALIPWLAMVVTALVALGRRARAPGDVVAGAGLALLGVLIAGMYHHVFLSYPIAWTVWAVAGTGLSPLGAAPGAVSPTGATVTTQP